MSRFDDELRAAARPLASEPLPQDVLDEALDVPRESGRRRWLIAGATAAVVGLVATGIGLNAFDDEREPGASASPSPTPDASAPASAVTVTGEEDGVRLTVTVDPVRVADGMVVMATTTAENVADEPRHWMVAFEGQCDWTTLLSVAPDVPIRSGREWVEEDLRGLKLRLLEQWALPGELVPMFFFPADRLPELSGFCNQPDAGEGVLDPGESRTDELVWRAEGPLGMPLRAGTYVVTAQFLGQAPGEDPRGAFTGPTLSLPIEVTGDDVDYLHPGEAVDVLLADAEFVQAFRAVERETIVEYSFEFVDDRWVFRMPISAPDDPNVLERTILAEVDAVSGEILELSTGDAPFGPAFDMPPGEAFDTPDDCVNPAAGYRVHMPDAWYYNTGLDTVDDCQWFAPVRYTVTDPFTPPAEVVITFRVVTGSAYGQVRETLSNEDYTVDGLPARRYELGAMPGGAPGSDDERTLVWIVGLDGVLPERPGGHAWLIAETSNERGDYEESVRILDRMIATLEVDRPN